MPATEMRHAVSSPPMAEALLNDYPEVEPVTRLRQSGAYARKYFGAVSWLQKFAYHIHFQVGIYLLMLIAVSLFVLILAMLSISIQSYRAASANPAVSLRAG